MCVRRPCGIARPPDVWSHLAVAGSSLSERTQIEKTLDSSCPSCTTVFCVSLWWILMPAGEHATCSHTLEGQSVALGRGVRQSERERCEALDIWRGCRAEKLLFPPLKAAEQSRDSSEGSQAERTRFIRHTVFCAITHFYRNILLPLAGCYDSRRYFLRCRLSPPGNFPLLSGRRT
ncbi:unnamed protein product [Leuciscus chuanchicus]